MKKILQKVICSAMIAAMALPFAACGNKNESWSTETTIPDNPAASDPDVTTITFAVPIYCHVDSDRLKLFNNELLNDGHKYQLKINTFEYDFENNQYFIDIENELNSGNADVAFLGLGDDDNNIYKLINSGAVMNLDEVISSDKGKANATDMSIPYRRRIWMIRVFTQHLTKIISATKLSKTGTVP